MIRSQDKMITADGNEAVASVAYRTNEIIAIYPITPSSAMGEHADDWAAHRQENIWGAVPDVVEMQSEAGAAGAVHGALQAGALTTTFTASQGLLLMIPNMYKIAGELNAFCMHVAARAVATHALSIFCDHSDVMACRQTGFAQLSSSSVQEAHDFACIAQAATLRSRIPFIHFFDGFRTSHEVAKIHYLNDDDLRSMMDEDYISAHRQRALTPDRPVIRGTTQNPDTYFQGREACNLFYDQCPGIVQDDMDRFAERTGRQYHLFDYVGHPQAERVIVLMGSGANIVDLTVERMMAMGDERIGVVKVRLYRPFFVKDFVRALPSTTRSIAVLDRTKEPGSIGEPLYLDIVSAIRDARAANILKLTQDPYIIGGRYGLGSKEFSPAMIKAVFDELKKETPVNHFTVGINDDVTHLSLPVDSEFDIESEDIYKAVFYGLGSDGTVGANKNTIKIIGQETDNYAQGYFVYDSKKAGGMTISHLRFGPRYIRSSYLTHCANFVACHHFGFLEQYDVLESATPGSIFLLNAPLQADNVWDALPYNVQRTIIDKKLTFYVIDAFQVAKEAGMGGRINTIMQTCFFAISQILPVDQAIEKIKEAIRKSYAHRGDEVLRRNNAAVDQALAYLHEVKVPDQTTASEDSGSRLPSQAPDFVQRVTSLVMDGLGDQLPVSAFPVDGTWPVGTTCWEKRNIALDIPIWDSDICIQCNKCAIVCPHAAIRAKVYDPAQMAHAPDSFVSTRYRDKDFPDSQYTLQVAPEDCTGCSLCVQVCPVKNKEKPALKAINMMSQRDHVARERTNYRFFLDLPEADRSKIQRINTKTTQLLQPLFEYSGACAGCGETPYIKLLTQLFGDHILIANATGCSSIYGGNLPTTPYCTNKEGKGPAWSNSLFEDNAEFGLGFRLALDSREGQAGDLTTGQSVWIIGGDGWAYDIGYGGLDHVLSLNRNVNVLVLDTEVYSNTGGQQSKATPLGAAAKFASSGKEAHKKDLGLMAMSYGHVYVANVALGANDNHTVKVFQEAESYPGPALIIAYSHCIAHGYDLRFGIDQQKRAVESGVWPLYRFDPRNVAQGKSPLQLDSKPPKLSVKEYMQHESRFRMVERIDRDRYHKLAERAQRQAEQRVRLYQKLAQLSLDTPNAEKPAIESAGG
jgi:pyruvate-ferredoxin/flavodoxin oxidoreductase